MAQRTQPDNVFFGLCAAEGQSRLTVNGRLVEGSSFALPWWNGEEQHTCILVTLHMPNILPQEADQGQEPVRDLGIIAEIKQAMVASLDLMRLLGGIIMGKVLVSTTMLKS
jgi:hypothetical protein